MRSVITTAISVFITRDTPYGYTVNRNLLREINSLVCYAAMMLNHFLLYLFIHPLYRWTICHLFCGCIFKSLVRTSTSHYFSKKKIRHFLSQIPNSVISRDRVYGFILLRLVFFCFSILYVTQDYLSVL